MQRTKGIGGQSAPRLSFEWQDMLVIAGLFLVAIWIGGDKVHYSHAYMMTVVGMACLSILMKNPALAALGLYASCWYAYLYSGAFCGTLPDNVLIQSLDCMTLIMAGMVIYIAVQRGKSEEAYKDGICVLAVILMALGLIQHFYGGGDPISTLANRNFFAAFVAVSTPFFFRRPWVWFLPLVVICLWIAQTSTAIAATLAAAGFYFLGWRGLALAVVPGAAYFHFIKGYKLFSGARWDFWTDAIDKVSRSWDSLLFGVGPGIYWSWGQLHSEYVSTLYNFGIVGLLLVAVYVVTAFRGHHDKIAQAALVAVLVDGIGNHVLHTAPTAMLAVIVMALIERERRERT